MVRLLLFLFAVFVGSSHAQVCSIDADCDAPMVCTAPPLKWGACVLPSRLFLPFSDPPRVNCLDGSVCPANHKCFRVMGSPLGVCVPKETPPESEPARHCMQTAQCKDAERCYRPPGTPIGVCVPKDSRKLFDSTECQFDGDCARDEFCSKPLGPSRTGKCFKKSRRFASDGCFFLECFPGQYCDKGMCYDENTGQPVFNHS